MPAGRPADERRALSVRPAAACRRAPTIVAERRPERDLGDAAPRRRRGPATRIVPGLAVEPIAANASAPLARIHGTAARVWTFWTTVGCAEEAALAGCGGRCSGWPRLPSSALRRTVSSPSM